MPAMPAMPQIKLPKSIPKFKSRKIFNRSREDVSKDSPKLGAGLAPGPPPIPPADFIKRTPTRISTISSLMQQHGPGGSRRNAPGRDSLECDYDTNTYRSADSIDDDYSPPNMPRRSPSMRSTAYPISPVKINRNYNADSPPPSANTDGSNANVKMSFGEKLQKGYKDFTEFRFKHILAKKTIVRKDNIEVDYYVKHYKEDLIAEEREQTRHDQEIAENYRFKFKESRQNTDHSQSISPMDSPIAKETSYGKAARSVGEQSGDESGMETSPPKRPPGIAASRFGKVRNPPLNHSLESVDSNLIADDHEERSEAAPNSSALWAIKKNKNQAANTDDKEQFTDSSTGKKGYKERLRRLTNYMSSQEETDKEETTTTIEGGNTKALSKARNFGKRQTSKEELDETLEAKSKSQQSLNEKTDNPLISIKQNIKRFKSTMSLKRQPTTVAANDTDDETTPTATKSKASISPQRTTKDKLVARLNRFKSRDEPAENETSPKKTESSALSTNISPIRAVINNKLQTWKKSFKKKPTETTETGADTGTDGETSPEKREQPKRSSTLVKKLKYIRSRKNPSNSNDELDTADTADEKDYQTPEKNAKDGSTNRKSTSNFEEKFENVRQRTLKKVNDKMQKIKFFHKSQEQIPKDNMAAPEDNEPTSNSTSPHIPTPTLKRRRGGIQSDYEHDSENEDDIEEINNIQGHLSTTQKIHAVWTTKPILSDSTESEDNDMEYPRVLIHQDNSDLYESTLIIAVTTTAPPSPMPKITEIPSTPKASQRLDQNTAKAIDWIPNREIISSFLEITPPSGRKAVANNVESTAPTIRGHARKLSIDSNSDSDSWIPETVRNKQFTSSREDTRRTSTAGLNSIQENEEPWRVHTKQIEEKLYKTKSIDIFEANAKLGGVRCAFEDFDDELKNEPVLKIHPPTNSTSDNESYGKDSSEEQDAADDDNSSRVTKIRVENTREDQTVARSKSPNITTISVSNVESQRQQFGNSRESLDANFDENEELYTDDDERDYEYDRPPSAAPSPPPSISPPPPPLPARQPSIRLAYNQAIETVAILASVLPPVPPTTLPPLPTSKPPIVPPPITQQPPKIPERTESMAHISKPLVKTSSLRLAYTEQVKPGDIGKVNKLISRFEQPNGKEENENRTKTGTGRRPRVIRRTMIRDSSEDYTEDEEEENYLLDKALENVEINDDYNNSKRDVTPTPLAFHTNQRDSFDIADEHSKTIKVIPTKRTAPIPKQLPTPKVLTSDTLQLVSKKDIENNNKTREEPLELKKHKTNAKLKPTPIPEISLTIPKISVDIDNNNKITQSRPSSEYGSPLEYPSSLIGSTETTPTPDRRQGQHHQELRTPGRRSRSKATEDDQYYSFDSDEGK